MAVWHNKYQPFRFKTQVKISGVKIFLEVTPSTSAKQALNTEAYNDQLATERQNKKHYIKNTKTNLD